MRKVYRAKRRKVGLGSVALLGAAISGVPVWGNGAAANATDGASRLEAAAREDGANGGFWPRLGTDAAQISEFDGNADFDGVLANVVGGDKGTSSETAARGSVESANFVGYSGDSDFAGRGNAVGGQTRLVGWAENGAVSNDARTLEPSTANGRVKPVGENGEIAAFGENSGNVEIGEVARRSKTPILRDEPVATAKSGWSLGSALVSTFGALAVVLGAFFALVAFLKRTGPKNGGVGSALEVVDSLPVGDKARLLTIRWGNRLILAAKTPEKLTRLSEIADVEEASAFLAEIERRKETASSGDVGAKAAAIWKRGRDAANVWRTAIETKGRRR